MSKNAIFDGYDFAANGLTITKLDMYTRAPKDLQLEDLADEDGAVLVSSRYKPKPITIEGVINNKADEATLEAAMDDMIANLSGEKRVLDIPHAGSTRRFIATAGDLIISRERSGATTAGFSIVFTVPEGFGSDTGTTTLASQTITTAQQNVSISIGGSFKAQPDITFTVTSVSGGSPSKAVRITNPTTTQGITITRNWAAGDVVVLNSRNRTVYVNNVQIYSTGAFPIWDKGSGILAWSDDFSARSVNLLATYTRRWS